MHLSKQILGMNAIKNKNKNTIIIIIINGDLIEK